MKFAEELEKIYEKMKEKGLKPARMINLEKYPNTRYFLDVLPKRLVLKLGKALVDLNAMELSTNDVLRIFKNNGFEFKDFIYPEPYEKEIAEKTAREGYEENIGRDFCVFYSSRYGNVTFRYNQKLVEVLAELGDKACQRILENIAKQDEIENEKQNTLRQYYLE